MQVWSSCIEVGPPAVFPHIVIIGGCDISTAKIGFYCFEYGGGGTLPPDF